jgi:hypothetical protein
MDSGFHRRGAQLERSRRHVSEDSFVGDLFIKREAELSVPFNCKDWAPRQFLAF